MKEESKIDNEEEFINLFPQWVAKDTFFLSLTPEEKVTFINRVKNKAPSPNSINDKWYGEIRYCSECKDTRVTSCCACGCGQCNTCNHRFVCYMPPTAIQNVTNFMTTIPLWDTAGFVYNVVPELNIKKKDEV
jgi:hypothetical protein